MKYVTEKTRLGAVADLSGVKPECLLKTDAGGSNHTEGEFLFEHTPTLANQIKHKNGAK